MNGCCYYRSLVLYIFFIIKLIEAVDVTNPMFWERSFSLNVTNPNAYGSLIQSTSFIVSSQDFQGLNTWSDYKSTPERVVFNFGDCCLSSNLTLTKLQEMNHNSVIVQALESAQNMALVKRGHCNWSEKISIVSKLSAQNRLNITAVMIYDNNTHINDSDIQVSSTAINGVGSVSPPEFSTPLPPSRDILNFTDNDLHSSNDPVVYFVPYKYGQTFINRLNAMYNASNPTIRDYWLITPYFEQVTWGFSSTDSFFATGKGYLSYIIALAAIFIIAVVVVRWWRVRRGGRFYGGGPITDSNGFPMQPRVNQIDPLPVDIVNKLPIDLYSTDLIKNENCAVCLEDFVPSKTDIRILPCGHGFCVLCIDPWLTQKSSLCPICKYDCLPSDLRAERDNNNQPQDLNPENNETYPVDTSSDENPHNIITIPPILTNVSSPPTSPPLHPEKQPNIDNNDPKENNIEENPFIDQTSSNLQLIPTTSAQATTPSNNNTSPPPFTTIDLSTENNQKEHSDKPQTN